MLCAKKPGARDDTGLAIVFQRIGIICMSWLSPCLQRWIVFRRLNVSIPHTRCFYRHSSVAGLNVALFTMSCLVYDWLPSPAVG